MGGSCRNLWAENIPYGALFQLPATGTAVAQSENVPTSGVYVGVQLLFCVRVYDNIVYGVSATDSLGEFLPYTP